MQSAVCSVCAVGNALLFLACADFDIWPLCWLGMVPLLWVLLDGRDKAAHQPTVLYGFVTGLFANGGGFLLDRRPADALGHPPFVAALPLFLLLIGYQAITFGLSPSSSAACVATSMLVTWPMAPLICGLRFCVCPRLPLVPVDYFRPGCRRRSRSPTSLGPGVSFVLVLSNAALWQLGPISRADASLPRRGLLIGPSLRPPILAAVTIPLVLGYGMMRIHQVDKVRAAAPKIRVGVVVANIGIHEKFVPGLRERQHALHLLVADAVEPRR